MAGGTGPARRNMLKMVYVTCWSLDEDESVALWNLYSTMTHGVAIRSSFRRLTSALNNSEYPIRAGRVSYIDYAREAITEDYLLAAFKYKKRSFRFESEVRGVAMDIRNGEGTRLPYQGPPGITIPVNIRALVDRVHVGPLAPSWFADVVRQTIDAFAPDVEVRQSDLAQGPVY
jgi:hypothetical protein